VGFGGDIREKGGRYREILKKILGVMKHNHKWNKGRELESGNELGGDNCIYNNNNNNRQQRVK